MCGVSIEMSEDMVRRVYIDEAAKDIKPTVRPKLYSVEFVPVEHNGTIQGMRYCCRCGNIIHNIFNLRNGEVCTILVLL